MTDEEILTALRLEAPIYCRLRECTAPWWSSTDRVRVVSITGKRAVVRQQNGNRGSTTLDNLADLGPRP